MNRRHLGRTGRPLAAFLVTAFLVAAALAADPSAQAGPRRVLVATEGQGYLETIDGYRVLHLKGTPEEMGRQHGRLLRQAVAENVAFLLRAGPDEDVRVGKVGVPRPMVAGLLMAAFADRVPEHYVKEMRGLAEAAGLPPDRVIACNLIPEAFHCSGFALLAKTTADGKLYHGRVLDYATDQRLQEHAVLVIQEPEGKVPFVNVTYAGFIGSVTGMNLEGISIGEMGGGGVGLWNGVPMAFLVRRALEESATLDQAVGVFRAGPRTCEYYYVIADARADAAVGMRATPETIEIITPGQAHPLLPTPVPDTVILSAGERYRTLVERVRAGAGRFTAESALRLMDGPVAMKSNLHNALMVPADGVVYVANASADRTPAWQQKYYRFDVRKLMASRPPPTP